VTFRPVGSSRRKTDFAFLRLLLEVTLCFVIGGPQAIDQ
jgi:hypothetical protein